MTDLIAFGIFIAGLLIVGAIRRKANDEQDKEIRN